MLDLDGDPILVAVTDLARLFGISARRIQQLADLGVLERVEHGKYDLADSTLKYCEYLRGIETSKDEKTARTRMITIKADLAELEHARQVGELVARPGLDSAMKKLGITLRNNILSAPDRLAAILAAEADAKSVYEILDIELRKLLGDILAAMDKIEVDDRLLDVTRRESLAQLHQAEEVEV